MVELKKPALDVVLEETFRHLEGRMLTVLDAVLSEPTQRESAKDLARQLIWGQFRSLTGTLSNYEML